jgi:hypothetical protein
MLKDDNKKAREISERFTTGFVDHSYCIKIGEVLKIGLKASSLTGEQLNVVWDIHKLHKKRGELELEQKRRKIKDELKDLPPELIDLLPSEFTGKSKDDSNHKKSKELSSEYA